MLKASCRYKIDAQDRVVSIGGAWTAFARENGGEKLLNNPPLGQSIWNFINGLSTTNIYHVLFKQVRETGSVIRFPFRGDSPDSLRYMEMELSLGEDGSIWLQTTVTRVLDRQANAILSNQQPREQSIVQMCAWCNLALVYTDWLSLEDAIWMLGLFDKPEAPPISHSICPECVQILNKNVEIKKALFNK